jgi:hypothetical protein
MRRPGNGDHPAGDAQAEGPTNEQYITLRFHPKVDLQRYKYRNFEGISLSFAKKILYLHTF